MQITTLLLAILTGAASATPVLNGNTSTDISTTAQPTTTTLNSPEIFTITAAAMPTATGSTGGVSPDSTGEGRGSLNTTDITHAQRAYCSGRSMQGLAQDLAKARAQMMAFCTEAKNFQIGPRNGARWRSGNVQIYFCNFSPDTVSYKCNAKQFDDKTPYIDSLCGAEAGGWFNDGDVDYYASVGRDPLHDENGNKIEECGWKWGGPA